MTEDAFLEILSRCVVDASIVDRIDSILKGYACLDAEPEPVPPIRPPRGSFSSSSNYDHSRFAASSGSNYDHNRSGTAHPSRRHPLPPHHGRPVKLLGSSAMLALLNKLTKSNYTVILQRCKTLLKLSSDIGPYVESILTKACVDVTFVDLYFKLILDLQVVEPAILHLLNHGLPKMIEFHASNDPPNDDYDAFCKRNKQKIYVAGMNEMILKLIADKKLTAHLLPPASALASHRNYINFIIGQNVSITMLRQLKRAFEVLHYYDSKFVDSLQSFLKSKRKALSMQEVFAIEDISALFGKPAKK
jgi:hypothetical protein